jgi:nicotinamidase-related amidase
VKEIFGLEVPNSLLEVCRRERMALLVYDMQVGIASQIKGADAIVAKAGQVLKAARDAGMRIFFTRHMSLPLELMGAFQFRMAMKWQRVDEPGLVKPWFLRDSPGFPIVPSLTPRASEAVLDKITMSAFEGTPLQIALRDCAISAIAIVGIALEVGIEPTARHASDLGLIPVIIADACGLGNAEAAKRSLESLAFEGNTMITDVAAFIDALARSSNDRRH